MWFAMELDRECISMKTFSARRRIALKFKVWERIGLDL
jgi:hypothetical protein